MKSSPSVLLLLFVFLLLGMLLRVGAALKFPTVDSPDEILETPGTRTSPGLRLQRGGLGMEAGSPLLGVSRVPGRRDANH
jgi:hypothetical protein